MATPKKSAARPTRPTADRNRAYRSVCDVRGTGSARRATGTTETTETTKTMETIPRQATPSRSHFGRKSRKSRKSTFPCGVLAPRRAARSPPPPRKRSTWRFRTRTTSSPRSRRSSGLLARRKVPAVPSIRVANQSLLFRRRPAKPSPRSRRSVARFRHPRSARVHPRRRRPAVAVPSPWRSSTGSRRCLRRDPRRSRRHTNRPVGFRTTRTTASGRTRKDRGRMTARKTKTRLSGEPWSRVCGRCATPSLATARWRS